MTDILITTKIPQFLLDRISKLEYTYYVHEGKGPIDRDVLKEKIKGIKGLICTLGDLLDEEVLSEAGPQLKVISTISVGYDHIDIDYLRENNIRLGYTPGILTEATAEIAVSLVLSTSRRLFEANRKLINGDWKSWKLFGFCGRQISYSNVGIFGLGKIGKSIAEKMASFHPKNIFYTGSGRQKDDIFLAEFSSGKRYSAKFLEKNAFIKECDIIIVSCSLNEQTKNYFDKEVFDMMKKNCIFVNVARGTVVNQTDLFNALESGKLFGAGLDVMTPEPIPTNDPLLKINNCNLLPHIGSATTETRTYMCEVTLENLFAGMIGAEMKFECHL